MGSCRFPAFQCVQPKRPYDHSLLLANAVHRAGDRYAIESSGCPLMLARQSLADFDVSGLMPRAVHLSDEGIGGCLSAGLDGRCVCVHAHTVNASAYGVKGQVA